MALTFSILTVISINTIAAYAQGAVNMTGMTRQKSTTIHAVPEHESAEQIRDEIRSNHPLLAALADQIQTMDERETLNFSVGVAIVAGLLKMHAAELIINQTSH